jgi:hypothetical protein
MTHPLSASLVSTSPDEALDTRLSSGGGVAGALLLSA